MRRTSKMLAGLTFVVAISLASSEEVVSKQILEPNPIFSEENYETAFEGTNVFTSFY